MAKTMKGMMSESEAYDKILYVSEERLRALTDKENVGNAKTSRGKLSSEAIMGMLLPEDMSDSAVLIPVDITGPGEKFEGDLEKMVSQLGANGVLKLVVEAEKRFKTSSKNFPEDERPIPMTVAEWKEEMAEAAGDEEEDDDEDDEDDEEDGEEEGEEEDGEGDDGEEGEDDAPPAKKKKVA
eukprot:TRINITY_DN1879_c0_g1_i1.p2 TRINITY_DN1879_c0_g1~~TRINITY_DN1879_c0_g1_i1.p2  ORF type:complete len:208 (-),score=82.62 TRINITY_DN1879_c0_g1_i1:227-772(-)